MERWSVRLQQEPIAVEPLIREVLKNRHGAVSVFLGTVRDHNAGRRVRYLEYEAYAGMAEREMGRIRERALERFEIDDLVLVHRTGRLEIGEASVAVVAVSAHRAPAMEACRFAIDALKDSVPIWKKEFFEGGEAWIEGAGRPPEPL